MRRPYFPNHFGSTSSFRRAFSSRSLPMRHVSTPSRIHRQSNPPPHPCGCADKPHGATRCRCDARGYSVVPPAMGYSYARTPVPARIGCGNGGTSTTGRTKGTGGSTASSGGLSSTGGTSQSTGGTSSPTGGAQTSGGTTGQAGSTRTTGGTTPPPFAASSCKFRVYGQLHPPANGLW